MTAAMRNAGPAGEVKSLGNGYVFGAPVKELGWFASLIMGLATGMMAFFAATFVAIMVILFWRAAGHPAADFTIAYRMIGLPIGVGVMVLALAYLAFFWTKRILRKA